MPKPAERRPYKPSSRGPLHTVPMDWGHCLTLAKYMAKAEQEECIAMGATPLQALAGGCLLGWSTAVIRNRTDSCVGAFGCNGYAGSIWSLWGPLGIAESVQVLRETPAWVKKMVTRCGGHRPLTNFVSVNNERALRWIKETDCFIIDDKPICVGPKLEMAYGFMTKEGMHQPHVS